MKATTKALLLGYVIGSFFGIMRFLGLLQGGAARVGGAVS